MLPFLFGTLFNFFSRCAMQKKMIKRDGSREERRTGGWEGAEGPTKSKQFCGCGAWPGLGGTQGICDKCGQPVGKIKLHPTCR